MPETDGRTTETQDAYLAALGASLTAQVGTDAELANILATHVVKAEPAKDAVAVALDAIRKLAAERAGRSEAESDRG